MLWHQLLHKDLLSCLLALTLAHIMLTDSWLICDSRFFHSSCVLLIVRSQPSVLSTLLPFFVALWGSSSASAGFPPLTHGLSLLKSVLSLVRFKMECQLPPQRKKKKGNGTGCPLPLLFFLISVLVLFNWAVSEDFPDWSNFYDFAPPECSYVPSVLYCPVFADGNETDF